MIVLLGFLDYVGWWKVVLRVFAIRHLYHFQKSLGTKETEYGSNENCREYLNLFSPKKGKGVQFLEDYS